MGYIIIGLIVIAFIAWDTFYDKVMKDENREPCLLETYLEKEDLLKQFTAHMEREGIYRSVFEIYFEFGGDSIGEAFDWGETGQLDTWRYHHQKFQDLYEENLQER